MAINQSHERFDIKYDDGAIGKIDDASDLWRWIVAGPEVCSTVADWQMLNMKQPGILNRRVRSTGTQIILYFKKIENPFQEETND